MPTDVFSEYFLARQGAIEKTEKELNWHPYGDKYWLTYGSDAISYAETFAPILPEGSFAELVLSWKKPGLILESFGDGSFVRSLLSQPDGTQTVSNHIAGGLAVTLVDLRKETDRTYDETNNIKLVAGDFYQGLIRKEIKIFLEQNQSIGFSLIICRPILGWELADREPPGLCLIWITMKKLFDFLDINGELFVSLPAATFLPYSNKYGTKYVPEIVWQNWSEDCRKNNVSVVYDGVNGALRIKKLTPNSVLPRIRI